MVNKVDCNPLIVTGIHRSGTSLLSKILENQNIFFGKYKDVNNESIFFQNINNLIMSMNNSSWDNPRAMLVNNSVDIILEKVKLILDSKINYKYFGLNSIVKKRNFNQIVYNWGWKDPRNIFTLPLWLKIFPNAKVIILVRHPYDVVNSLIHRNKIEKKKINLNIRQFIPSFLISLLPINRFSNKNSKHLDTFEEGMKLYEQYYLEINKLKLKFENSIYLIRYEDLVINPDATIENICKYYDIKVSKKNIKFLETISKERAYNFKSMENIEFAKYDKKLKNYGY